MEFKILKIVKNEFGNKNKRIIESKYRKILGNLLAINPTSDSGIFSKMNNLNKDLNKLLKSEDINKIWTNFDFKIKIKKTSLSDLKNSINNSLTPEEVKITLSEFDYNITKILERQLFISFNNAKSAIITRIEKEDNTFLTKWKKYQKITNDTFKQTNVWPLFIGSYFIKGNISDKPIYAPLILKEVNITIDNNEVYLVSKSQNVTLNDKLTFFLEQSLNIDAPIIDVSIDKINFNDLSAELDYFFQNIITIKFFDNETKFEELSTQEVVNPQLKKSPGIILLHCQPAGSSLRKATLDLIESGEINNLLYIENQLVDFNKKSIKNIVQNDLNIARICQTDASQEKAILSSLQEHAIIIGPPGTGKSQTIANLLTNILYNNKRALFISQKRIALEVVVERMGQLEHFMLQLVEKQGKVNKGEKEEFYWRLKKFIEYAKDGYVDNTPGKPFTSLINKNTKTYWKAKQDGLEITQEELDLICDIKSKFKTITPTIETEIKKVFWCLFELKKMNKESDIEEILSYNERDIKGFSKKTNFEVKKILGIRMYGKDFKHLFSINLILLDFMEKTNTDIKFISLIKKIKSIEKLALIFKIYPILEMPIKSTSAFESDEYEVLKRLKIIANERMKKIEIMKKVEDKTWMGKFLGRIDRAYTVPQNFISLFKNELKQMFSVIVSTPESLSSFIDFKKDKFDYVIFDEASQIFLEKAIPFISVGTKIIIAGDDQQMQPSNWFSSRVNSDGEDEVENIDSLLTYAIANSLPRYNLELNYRSANAALTTFSSKQFYDYNLKTLDNINAKKNAIEVINVVGTWNDSCNLEEAKKMISILQTNISKFEKIILLTFNKNQLDLVDDMIATKEPELYDKIIEGKIILKNLENIQGDEADLVIASIGYTKDSALASTYVGRPGGKNALNVAITRAKSKMIILKSISSNEIKISNSNNIDLLVFRNWIQFLELTENKQKEYAIKANEENVSVESNFENEVYQWLLKQRLNMELDLHTQYSIGSYRIDLALVDKISGKFMLGIEVDGFKWHSTAIQKYNDIVRQDFIEAKGYKLIRISEVLWKTDKDKVLQMIENYI